MKNNREDDVEAKYVTSCLMAFCPIIWDKMFHVPPVTKLCFLGQKAIEGSRDRSEAVLSPSSQIPHVQTRQEMHATIILILKLRTNNLKNQHNTSSQ